MNVNSQMVAENALKRLLELKSRVKNVKAILNRVVYPMYIEAQLERFKTEGESEQMRWKPLTKRYQEYKLKKFAKYPYKGRRMGVATGRLLKSLVDKRSGEHYKIVREQSLTVGTRVSYAKYFDDKRTISKWRPEFIKTIKKTVLEYLAQ